MANTDVKETYLPGILHCRTPSDNAAPLVFDIPRSGSDYPREFQSSAKFDAVRRLVSMYVEDLYKFAPDAGATWLFALFANAYIDARPTPGLRHRHRHRQSQRQGHAMIGCCSLKFIWA